MKSLIYNVIYENLVFIKYLIHKVNGSILFCLHNHNEQFTMEPVLFENHKLDCLIPKVKREFLDGIKLFIQTIELLKQI